VGHPCYRCPLSARLDAPTPLPLPGPAALLIGGGCLCWCHSRRHRPPCGRPWGTGKIDEGDRRAPTRRIDLSCSDGAPAETKSWEKRPATGRWRTKMGQRVDAAPPQTQELPERRPGELQRGVTGARYEPGAAVLARHLPSWAAERPIFLLGSAGLVRWVSSWGDAFAVRLASRRR